MSLDNFQLPVNLIPGMYNNSLVVLDADQSKPDLLKESRFKYTGMNKRSILMLVNDDSGGLLNDADLQFLGGILSACKLGFEDVALLNINQQSDAEHEALQQAFNPVIIISFGIELSTMGFPLHIPHFQLQSHNGQTFLHAPSLASMRKDVQLKKELWSCLKKIFNL